MQDVSERDVAQVRVDGPTLVTVERLPDEPAESASETADRCQDDFWFRMFWAVIEKGTWATLSFPAAKVYVVIAQHVNRKQQQKTGLWIANPELERIQKLTGLMRSSVFKGISELEERGLVVKLASGQGRHAGGNVYQLIPPPRSPHVRHRGRHTSAITDVTRPPSRTSHVRHHGLTNKDEQDGMNSSSSRPAAADLFTPRFADAIGEALAAVGIGSPKREELAALYAAIPNAAAVIREVAGKLPVGSGTGLLVLRLVDRAEQEATRVRLQAETRERERQEREAAAAAESARRREREQLAADLAGLAPNDVAGLVTELQLSAANPLVRDCYLRNPDPHRNCLLAVDVVRLARVRGLLQRSATP